MWWHGTVILILLNGFRCGRARMVQFSILGNGIYHGTKINCKKCWHSSVPAPLATPLSWISLPPLFSWLFHYKKVKWNLWSKNEFTCAVLLASSSGAVQSIQLTLVVHKSLLTMTTYVAQKNCCKRWIWRRKDWEPRADVAVQTWTNSYAFNSFPTSRVSNKPPTL